MILEIGEMLKVKEKRDVAPKEGEGEQFCLELQLFVPIIMLMTCHRMNINISELLIL